MTRQVIISVMKICLTSILLSVCIVTFAQQKDISDVSRKVIDEINKKYPHSKLIHFKKKTDLFKATFMVGGKKFVSTFAKDGDWLKTETAIQWKDLPGEVRAAYWKTSYRQYKMEDINQVETPGDGTLFVFEVKDVGDFDPGEREIASVYAIEYLVYFNSVGEMTKEIKEE